MNNEQGLYESVYEMAQNIIGAESDDGKPCTTCLADEIEGMFTELFDFDSMFENRELYIMREDIGSLYRVNWYEIAEAVLSDIEVSA